MEKIGIKRMRSEEDAPYAIQYKMHVNEKIVATNDVEKIKVIHEKTRQLLYAGARNEGLILPKNNASQPIPLWQQVVLVGNGNIEFRKDQKRKDFTMERRPANCCQRKVFIHSKCFNCNMALCEECGYSCIECGQFLCGSCVSLFGCGTADRPVCEKCSMFM